MAKRRSKRLPVQRRGEDTRARIIAAAKEILSRDGYENASVREIAQEAKVARGLIHYYFATKEELLIAVVKAAAAEFGQKMAELRRAPKGPNFRDAAFAVHQDRVREDPVWYRLRYDLYALALRKPAFRSEVRELLDGARRGITAGMVRSLGSMKDEEQGQALASIFLACFEGLALQKLVDPAFDLERAYAELRRVAEVATRPPMP